MKKFKSKNKITLRRVKELREAGRVAFVYPRKGMVCVDGSKYFQLAS